MLSATLLKNNECKIQLQYIFTALNVSFNAKYEHITDSLPRFFDGNPSKNKWFNGGEKNDFIADQYILYKELGDILQAYYGAKRIAHNLHQFKLCFFTNDTNALYRCILLHVPGCIAKSCGKNQTQFHYHPAMSDIRIKWQEQHRDALVEHNQDAMNQINRVLQRGMYYTLAGQCIHFEKSSRLAQFLEDCIRTIRSTTERFISLPTENISLQEYSKMCGIFKASRLFNQSVASRSTQALFIEPHSSSHLFPKPFCDFLNTLQRGGDLIVSESEWAPYIKDSAQDDYTQIDPEIPEVHLPIVYVLQGLFAEFQKHFPEKTTDQLRFLAEDVNAKFIQFFGVTGRPSWEPEFLKLIVDMYLNGTLQTMTHEDFEEIHAPIIEKAMDADWEWKLLESKMPPTPNLREIITKIKHLENSNVQKLRLKNLPMYRPLIKARRFTRKMKTI